MSGADEDEAVFRVLLYSVAAEPFPLTYFKGQVDCQHLLTFNDLLLMSVNYSPDRGRPSLSHYST